MENRIKVKIKQCYDTEENYKTNNPVLLAGQLAYTKDKYGQYKIGDGITHWNDLDYTENIFIGTQEEYEEKNAAGEIKPGTIVYITDDRDYCNINIDKELSETSTNLIENQAVAKALKSLSEAIQLINEDLNNLTEYNKRYYAAGGNTVANKPTGVNAFGMETLRVASGWTVQLLYASDTARGMYIRFCGNGTWSAWEKLASENYAMPRAASYNELNFTGWGNNSILWFNFRDGLTNAASTNVIDTYRFGKGLAVNNGNNYANIHVRNALINERVQPLQGTMIGDFTGANGTAGYLKFATITIIGTYANRPCTFIIGSRGLDLPIMVAVNFKPVNNHDPDYSTFLQLGHDAYMAYIVKESTSKWSLYLQKNEAYGEVYVWNAYIPQGQFTVTYPNTQVTSLPSGAVVASIGGVVYKSKALVDSGNNNITTLAYSKTQLTYSDFTYLAAWNGYELRSVAKSHFMREIDANGYWGMTGGGSDTVWVRTTNQGLLPYQSGGRGSGHQYLGTSSWYFKHAYIDNIYGVIADLSGSVIVRTKAMPLSNGLCTEVEVNTTRIYRDGIVMSFPGLRTDQAWIRVVGSGNTSTEDENNTLEIATGDDAKEAIVVRQYNTSNAIARQVNLLDKNGNSSFPGSVTVAGILTLTRTTDSAATADNGPALIVGGTRTTAHLELDANELMAKSNGTTAAPLYLNDGGGAVYLSSGSKVNVNDGVYTSSVTTSTHLNGAKGTNVIINSTAAANGYNILAKMNSNNGTFSIGYYQGAMHLYYVTNTKINANTNGVDKDLKLLDESGNSSFPGTVSAGAFSSSGSSSLTTATITNLTVNGSIRLKNSTAYGMKLNFGDGDYVYLHEDSDDHLSIYAKEGINISGGSTNIITGTNGSLNIKSASNSNSIKLQANNAGTYLDITCSGSNSKAGIEYHFYSSSEYVWHQPHTDNRGYLGSSDHRWTQVYAINTAISSSDQRQKKEISYIGKESDYKDTYMPDKILVKFINGLMACIFKRINGESDRPHHGFVAQDVEKLLLELGIKDHAAFIKSPVEKDIETTDENGNKIIIKETIEGEYTYGLRYEEFISDLTRYCQILYKRNEELENIQKEQEKKMKELENRLSDMEAKLEKLLNAA